MSEKEFKCRPQVFDANGFGNEPFLYSENPILAVVKIPHPE